MSTMIRTENGPANSMSTPQSTHTRVKATRISSGGNVVKTPRTAPPATQSTARKKQRVMAENCSTPVRKLEGILRNSSQKKSSRSLTSTPMHSIVESEGYSSSSQIFIAADINRVASLLFHDTQQCKVLDRVSLRPLLQNDSSQDSITLQTTSLTPALPPEYHSPASRPVYLLASLCSRCLPAQR